MSTIDRYHAVLYNGHRMPLMSVGTYKINSKEETFSVVDNALRLGYRSFDTARVYNNEQHLGPALTHLLAKHHLTREDVFITSKLGPNDQGKEASRQAILKSLSLLHTSYIDLYLIHWPGAHGLKVDSDVNAVLRRESWEVMQEFCRQGVLKSIGVSNYTQQHLAQLLQHSTIKPALLQTECHPHLPQNSLRSYCTNNNILFQAYSSLGTTTQHNQLLRDERVVDVAGKCAKSPAQVLLKWALQLNMGVIPKSTNPVHMQENIESFEFELSEGDMKDLSTINNNTHYCWDPSSVV